MQASPLGSTDPTRWRLDSGDAGRHVFHYARAADESGAVRAFEDVWGDDDKYVKEREGQTDEELYWLGLEMPSDGRGEEALPATPLESARRGYDFYKRIQAPDGHWSGEYGGPLFLLPGIVFAMFITGTPIPEEWKIEMTRYLANVQRNGGEGDEGWGLHTAGVSTVFGTSLNYAVMRILGVDAEEPMLVRARATLHYHGGALAAPSWAKFWLSVLNLYDWEGSHPIPPEVWLLPHWLPLSPTNWWSYNRMVVLPMSYLSGKRFKTPLSPLLLSLREELYVEPYDQIRWKSHRSNVSAVDLAYPHPLVLELSFFVVGIVDRVIPSSLRKRALDYTYRLICMEDENTSYQCQAPVNKAMNMVARWDREGPSSDAYRLHKAKLRDFLWVSPEGMMVCGTNGSQLWDAAFIAQALFETGLATEPSNAASVAKLHEWLDDCQIKDNPKYMEEMCRHPSKGAWPFSTREQGYTVSDTTAEGLKAVMYLQSLPGAPQLVSRERMCDSIDIILSLQNPCGGFASCELVRGPRWLELLNPAEVFRDIMVEIPYAECTTACVTALSTFKKKYPNYRREEVEIACTRAIYFIHSIQLPDGSWYGSWAICFTYATMFALESLALAGETVSTSSRARRACEFLLSKQMDDGGWGETIESCETKKYVHSSESQVVQTAWAVLGLLTAKSDNHDAIRRGCRLLMSRQLVDGSWAQENIEGVFNNTCGISYPNYKFAWVIWALGKAQKELGGW